MSEFDDGLEQYDWQYNSHTSFCLGFTPRATHVVQFELLHLSGDRKKVLDLSQFHLFTHGADITPYEIFRKYSTVIYEIIGDWQYQPMDFGETNLYELNQGQILPASNSSINAHQAGGELVPTEEYLVLLRSQLLKQGLFKLATGLIVDLGPILLSAGTLAVPPFSYAENQISDELLKFLEVYLPLLPLVRKNKQLE